MEDAGLNRFTPESRKVGLVAKYYQAPPTGLSVGTELLVAQDECVVVLHRDRPITTLLPARHVLSPEHNPVLQPAVSGRGPAARFHDLKLITLRTGPVEAKWETGPVSTRLDGDRAGEMEASGSCRLRIANNVTFIPALITILAEVAKLRAAASENPNAEAGILPADDTDLIGQFFSSMLDGWVAEALSGLPETAHASSGPPKARAWLSQRTSLRSWPR